MSIKGLDTNVLVRYIVQDDKKQAKAASGFIRKVSMAGETCFINCIVLCELIWVLESAYDFPRKDIVGVCDMILRIKQFEIEDRDIVHSALLAYRKGKGDFADHLIGRINQVHGCDMTVTFDQSLKKQDGFIILS
jgi:predicted nucleic-acid-binding protein